MLFFFFKQKTAYDMRISDWSSDVCSSDLLDNVAARLLLDWDASDSLRFSFNLNGWRDQNDPTAPQYTKAVPQNPPGSAGTGGVVPANLPAFIYPPDPHNARAADWNPYLRPFQHNKFWQTALRTDWDLTQNLTVTSIPGYRDQIGRAQV